MPSRGQRVRLAMLRALHQNPRMLIIDEPTSGLQSVLAHQILFYLKNKMSTGILVVAEHRAEIIESIAPTQVIDIGANDCWAVNFDKQNFNSSYKELSN